MNKLLQHLIDSGDVSHKVLPSLMKFQLKGEVPAGLKPIPRSGGDIASLPQVQKQIILSKDQLAKNKAAVAQRVASENAKILAERKARLAGAEKAKSQPFSAKQLAEETQATGDKLRFFPNDPNSFIDDYLNPGVFIGNMASGLGRVPLNIKEGNYGQAAWDIGSPALLGAAEKVIGPVVNKALNTVGKGLNTVSKNIQKQLPSLSSKVSLADRAATAAQTIDSEGTRIINRMKTPEGMRRMKAMFKKADPNLTDEQLNYAIENRLREMEVARDYSWPKLYQQFDDFPDLKKQLGDADIKSNIFPNRNAHYSPGNIHPNAPQISFAPDEMISGTFKKPKGSAVVIDPKTGSIDWNKSVLQLAKPHRYESFVDPNFQPGQITLGKGLELNKKIAGHEFIHALQGSGVTPIDDELRGLIRVNNPFDKLWNVGARLSPQLRGDFRYFQKGSGKREAYPFLEELRTRMLEKKIIADDYETITAGKLLKARMDAATAGLSNFKEGTRLIKFTAPWKYKDLARIMNEAPAVAPAIGVGAAAVAADQKKEGGEKTEYKGPSIVDYLATKGYSGKKVFRKELANKYGVEGYDYSAAKNTELLNRMRENDDLLETFKQTMQSIPVERMMEMERQQELRRSAPQNTNPVVEARNIPQVENNVPQNRGEIRRNQQVFPLPSNRQELPMYQPPRWNTTPQPTTTASTPGINPNTVWNTSGRNPRVVRPQSSNPLPGIDPNVIWNRSGVSPRVVNTQPNPNLPTKNQDWGYDKVPNAESFFQFDRFPRYPNQPTKAQVTKQVVSPVTNKNIEPEEYTEAEKDAFWKEANDLEKAQALEDSLADAEWRREMDEYILSGGKFIVNGRDPSLDWRYVQPGKSIPQNPLQQFPAYPARQVSDLPKKTTAKAAAKNLEQDIEEESWFEKAGSAIEDGMEYTSGLFNGIQRKVDSFSKEDPRSINKVNIPTTINRGLPGKTAGNKKDSVSAIPYGYKQLYAVPDSKNPKDSLVSFVNLFDNDEGGRYYIGHKAKEVTDAGAQRSFNNVEGVAHFLRDSDILPGQKITPKSWNVSKGYTYHTTSPGKTVSAAGFDDPNRFRMLYKPNPKKDGSYLAKYVKNADINPEREAQLKKEGWEQDFTVNAQHKFSDIAWNKDGPSTGYAAASKWLPLKNGKHTYIPYKSKDGFSRFSGGSGVYLFKDPKTGKNLGEDASGSVNTIRKIGEDLIKTFGLKPEDLEFAYHDMGSYSAKPKAHNGVLDYKQWLDYNTYNRGFSGAPMMIPKKNNGGPIVDPRGQWAHPGKVTRIPSNQITMQGVPYPVYAKPNNGQGKIMYPNQDYNFGGASYVDEYPMMKMGGGLLSRSVTCSSCGHSWKSVDGGGDPLHCHKCGGMVKMQKGGQTNIPKPKKKTLILAEHNPTFWDNPDGSPSTHINPFITEAAGIKKYLNKYFPSEDVEIVPAYKDSFKEALKRSDTNTRLVTLAHAGQNLFGVPTSEYMQSVSKTPYENCYAGTCYGNDIVEGKFGPTGIDTRNLNNFNVRSGHISWSGFAPVNRGGEEGFKDSFFRRSKNPEISKLQNEWTSLSKLYESKSIDEKEYFEKSNALSSKMDNAYKKHTINQEKATDVKTYNFVPYPARVNTNDLPLMGSYQIGGPTNLWKTNKKAWVDSVNNANVGNIDFVKRFYDQSKGSIQVPGKRGTSTHLMAYDPRSRRVYPEVVNVNGKLVHMPGDAAYNYAEDTKQYIKFPTAEQAKWYSSSSDTTSGYKMGTGVLRGFKSGGQHGGLDRWFAEKWVDVKTGKDCGRQEGESRAGYPACRPSKRVNSQTPKTSSEMSSAEKAKFKSSKTSSQRIDYNHKRNK
jgi:hypothetical protein